MFGLILTSMMTVMHLYVFWRVGSVPLLRRYVPGKVIWATGVLFWFFFVLGLVYSHRASGFAAGILEFSGMIWLATLFLLACTLLVVELVTGCGYLLPRPAPRLRGVALTIGLILALFALCQGIRPPIISEHTVRLDELPAQLDGLTLVVISDLHLGNQLGNSWLAARVRQIMAAEPDLILLVGDIYEGHSRPAEEVLTTMRTLTAPLGVWAVLGNHEFYGGQEVIAALSEDSGLTVLRNSRRQIRPGLHLAGMEGRRADRRPDAGNKVLTQTLTGHAPGVTILMSHKPWQVEAAAEAGVGLMVAGHTHNGQIWPFSYLVKRYFSYLTGRYEVNGMTLLVGRGTGTWGPRMRLWQRSEIIKITLHAADI